MENNDYPKWIAQIPKEIGNEILPCLHENGLVDKQFRISHQESFILVPLKNSALDELNDKSKVQILKDIKIISNSNRQFNFKLRKNSRERIKQQIFKSIPSEYHDLIPHSFDIIGNIAIIDINRVELAPLRPYLSIIGDFLLKSNKNLRSIFEKAGNIEGEFRTRKLNFVCGENNTQTIYKENGCRFQLNIATTFFTPRLSFERNRIANLSTKFNHYGALWDMFCGVGPYFIQIAKKKPEMKIFATDINHNAIKYAQQNIQLNKISTQIKCFQYDVKQIKSSSFFNQMQGNISRAIMNLPEKNTEFLSILPDFISKKGCLLHIYQFSKKPDVYQNAKQSFLSALNRSGLKLEKIVFFRSVKPYSPALDTTVIDAVIKK
ncbi:MAG: methyltransferase [Candidatus Lokiarchaeota archaeon]|nr:methyltransferase [Candidatus Harpocratesius repetitus]